MKVVNKSVMAVIIGLIVIGTVPAKAEDILDKVQVHGFVSQGYLLTDHNNFLADTESGSFEFNEIGINFTAQPMEKLRIGVQLFSRDLGDLDNNRVDLDYAYADYRWRDELGIRIGRHKLPAGLFMDSIDLDMTRTSIFLPFSVYEPRWRAVSFSAEGVNLYGTIKAGPMGSFEYSGSLGTNIFPKESIENQFQELMEAEIISERLIYSGRLIWNTPLKGLLVGGSYLMVEDLMAEGKLRTELVSPISQLGGLSLYPAGTRVKFNSSQTESWYAFLQMNIKKFTFTSEYHQMYARATLTTSNPYDPFVAYLAGFNGLSVFSPRSAGWYAQADYQFLDWLTAAATYGEYYYDTKDIEGNDSDPNYLGYQKDATVSLRFDINSNWNVKLETHFINGDALTVYATRNTLTETPEENWMLFAAKTSFYF